MTLPYPSIFNASQLFACLFETPSVFCYVLNETECLQIKFPRISCQLLSCWVLLIGALIGICQLEDGIHLILLPAPSSHSSEAAAAPAVTEQEWLQYSHTGQHLEQPQWSAGRGSSSGLRPALCILNRMWQRWQCIGRCGLLGSSATVSANFWSLDITPYSVFLCCSSNTYINLTNSLY